MKSIQDRYGLHAAGLAAHGQSHVLSFWPGLDDGERGALLDDLDQIDLERCGPLIETHVRQKPATPLPARLEPPRAYPPEPAAELVGFYRDARARGEALIRGGQVAAFTVAGGQGTRLGYDGPKGCFPASPLRRAPLFQLFAEALLGVERRYGKRPRWYIMTSPLNHVATVQFFEANAFFGLARDGVRFFPQGQMPAFTPDGRIAMSEPHRLALSPDGHGGSLQALATCGELEDMRRHGVTQISYFQVDNPLARPIDPLFVGLHDLTGSEMASKAVSKVSDTERVGNFCLADGKLTVIEYSDMPAEMAHARNADGMRRFDAGSIAIHVLNRSFVERLTSGGGCQLPWHRADKTVSIVDPLSGSRTATPAAVVKLEMFVFDALPLAANPLLMITPREEEFSPIKNAEGNDSPASSRRDQIRRAGRWLERAGVAVPRSDSGEPAAEIEISPAFACDADELCTQLRAPVVIRPGGRVLLE